MPLDKYYQAFRTGARKVNLQRRAACSELITFYKEFYNIRLEFEEVGIKEFFYSYQIKYIIRIGIIK